MLERMRSCCGIGELSGLDSVATTSLLRMCNDYFGFYNTEYKMVVFTDAVGNKGGVRLAEYIVKNKLGVLVASEKVSNPNTRRRVQLWTWYPNKKTLRAWFNTHTSNAN